MSVGRKDKGRTLLTQKGDRMKSRPIKMKSLEPANPMHTYRKSGEHHYLSISVTIIIAICEEGHPT